MKKKLLMSKLYISCYPEQYDHINEKVKVVLDLSNYVTKKELNDATNVDTRNLAAKSDFVALETYFEKLDIIKFVNN